MAKGDARSAYAPESPADVNTVQELTAYVQRELMEISNAFSNAPARQVDLRNDPPDKPRDGMIVMADGTNWNPGQGRGLYQYDSSAGKWLKLSYGAPTGSICWVPANVPPDGYVKGNGSLLLRASYPDLWTYAQASGNIVTEAAWTAGAYGSFSTGNLSTNFRVPDLRGYFIRGWDDARGVDAGRGIGTSQADDNKPHNHGVTDPGHTHTVNDPGHSHVQTVFAAVGNSGNIPIGFANVGANVSGPYSTSGSGTGVTNNSNTTGITTQNAGAEGRPKNIALLGCIKT